MTTISPRSSRRARRCRAGYSLLEMLIAISLMSLLFLGAMDLVINASRTTVKSQAQMNATSDAANSIQKVIAQIREGQQYRLPTGLTTSAPETSWVTPTGTTQGQFFTTLNGGTVNAAIEITAPPALTPALNGYKLSVSNIQVQLASGTAQNLTGSQALYSCQTPGAPSTPTVVTLIYRGDPDGTPDPDPTGSAVANAGTYLWQYTIPSTNVFNTSAYPPVALCKSVSTAPNAVQFDRPSSQQDQAEIKITSGYYSPINGTQTSEEGNGTSTSQLTGKCVYMRDKIAGAVPGSASQSSNNPFQHH